MPTSGAITVIYLTRKIQIVTNPISLMVEIWAEVTPPSYQQPYWVGEIMMSSGGRTWRQDTVVDTEKEHFVRRVREEIEILRGDSDTAMLV